MRGLVAVARRELSERRVVFAGAAVLGVLPFLAPLLRSMRHYGPSEVRLLTATFLALCFASALSLILGASVIGRDLSERRIGFYFSRPLPSGAIWGGKFLGVWLLVIGGAILILLPTALVDLQAGSGLSLADLRIGPGWHAPAAFSLGIVLAFVGAVVLFLGLGNVVGLAFRSRSVWLIGDLGLLVIWLFLTWSLGVPLLSAGAWAMSRQTYVSLAVGAAGALLAASAAQVAVGRTDVLRGNRARFVALWGALFTVAALFAGYVHWITAAAPSDLLWSRIHATAPRGSWIAVQGQARGRLDYHPAFLLDVASGRFVRVKESYWWEPVFSGDGGTAAWLEHSALDRRGPADFVICSLDGAETLPRQTKLTFESNASWRFRLSEDGARLAAFGKHALSAYEIATGRLLGSSALNDIPGGDRTPMRFTFVRPDLVRLYTVRNPSEREHPPGEVRIFEFDLAARRLTQTVLIAPLQTPFFVTTDDRHNRLLIREPGQPIGLYEASSSARLASLGPVHFESARSAFLFDGRTVVTETWTDGVSRLHVFSTEGKEERTVDLGPVGGIALGGEPAAGQLAVAVFPSTIWKAGGSRVLLVNVSTGETRELGKHMYPLAAGARWFGSEPPQPGSEATKLFYSGIGSLIWVDPKTGQRRTILTARER